jgi:hypothetical protein
MCELNKAIMRTTMSNVASVATLVGRSIGRTLDTSRTAGKTVAGQTRSATERAGDTVATNVRTVAGQARQAASTSAKAVSDAAREVAGQANAQGGRVAASVGREANHVVDEATRRVSNRPASGTSYQEWTKAQLMDRARELDIDGRATMNKAELVEALRR